MKYLLFLLFLLFSGCITAEYPREEKRFCYAGRLMVDLYLSKDISVMGPIYMNDLMIPCGEENEPDASYY